MCLLADTLGANKKGSTPRKISEAEAKDKNKQSFSFQWGRGGCQ